MCFMFGKSVDRVSRSINLMVYGPQHHCSDVDEEKGLSQKWMQKWTSFHNWCRSYLKKISLTRCMQAELISPYPLFICIPPAQNTCSLPMKMSYKIRYYPNCFQHYNYIILPKQKKWHSFNCLLCVCPTPPPESHHLHWASCLGQNFQTGILMISCLSISDKKIRNSFLL